VQKSILDNQLVGARSRVFGVSGTPAGEGSSHRGVGQDVIQGHPDIEKYRDGWHRIQEFLTTRTGVQATNKAPSDL
jgi:hypothetical protein